MRRFLMSVFLVAVGCAPPSRSPTTVIIPAAPLLPAEALPQAVPEVAAGPESSFVGTWLENLPPRPCRDETTVRVLDGALRVRSKPCYGTSVYETESAKVADGELEVEIKDATSGVRFHYHLKQKSARELDGRIEITINEEDEHRVLPVTWTKSR